MVLQSRSWRYRHAPRQFADLNRLDDLLRRDVDYRDVVGDAVGHQQIFFIRRECHVPDPLADQQIFGHGPACGIDDRYAIGRPQRDKGGLVVPGDADADRLDRFAAQSRNVERDLADHRVFDGVDDRNGAADLRRYPEFGAVMLELGKARPRIHQHVGNDLARGGIDEMRHVGGFGRVDQDLSIRTDRHSLGFDTDLNVAEPGALLEVDDGDGI